MIFRTCNRLYYTFILSLFTTLLFSQPQATSTDQFPDEVTLTGTLVEASSGEPLPYATVVLYSSRDSSMVASALTDEEGNFSVKAAPGEYYAVIQFVGFENKVVPDLIVEGNKTTINLGEIAMRSDAVDLQQVEVRGERSQMEFKLDRRVFNVGKDLANAGNSAADILDRIPSITVDPEGNVSLRGSQGVRILVNGKPSGLLSAGETEALLRMQGDIIQSVEVITNPSARYEAEGEAGIINIILKKNKEKGINGSFGATAGHPQNYGASYNLNYRRQNFNFFSNFGIDYRKSPGGGNSTQRFFEDGTLTQFYDSETDQLRGGGGGYLQLGADWNIDEHNILTGSLLYRLGEDDNEAMVTYRDFDENRNLLNETIRDIAETQRDHNLETSLSYKRTYEDHPDREWTFDFKYILDDDTELATYDQTSNDSREALLQRSSNTEDEINLLLQTDYIHPIGENSQFETGLRAALRTVNNDFLVEEEQENGEYATLPSFDDQLKYTENIYAAYVIGAHEFGAFSLQAGLRAELSDIQAALLRSDQVNNQDYLSFFPSAALSYKLSEENQVQLSYSRRLSRPYFRRLLPFSNFNDPRNNGIGNPNLRPEFTNAFEASYLYYLEKGSLLSGVYYRRTSGVIEELTLPASDGTSIDYPVNLSTRDAYGLEFNFSYNFTERWDFNTDLNFFRAIVNGSFEGVDYSADTYTWSGGVNSQLDLSDRLEVQASFDYNAPRRTTQGRRLSSYNLDLAAALDVFSGRGTITLSARDIFNTRVRRTIIDLPDYKAETRFQWRQTRRVVLTFNYRLNQEKREGRGVRD